MLLNSTHNSCSFSDFGWSAETCYEQKNILWPVNFKNVFWQSVILRLKRLQGDRWCISNHRLQTWNPKKRFCVLVTRPNWNWTSYLDQEIAYGIVPFWCRGVISKIMVMWFLDPGALISTRRLFEHICQFWITVGKAVKTGALNSTL